MSEHDPYAALRLPAYRRFFSGNFIANLGWHMQGTAVMWDIYDRTHSKFSLGMAGLIQFLPVVTLFLVAGHVVDRWDRRRIVMTSQAVISLCALGLAWIASAQADQKLIYVCLALMGAARCFTQPAKAALLPGLVPAAYFSNAVTWNSSGFHLASVLGPALGGFMIKWFGTPVSVYVVDAVASATLAIILVTVRPTSEQTSDAEISLAALSAGFRFVWREQVILGALALDLFAVLLGGAVTLLPVYAEDILHVGPDGQGWLRAAPAVGALAMGMFLAHRPPMRQAGRALLISVAGFGLATIGFGFSTAYWLAWAFLFLTGATDNISVVIRHTLVQRLTPDALRGRVSAVNSLFIGASNELGGFESGIVAHYWGPVFSVVSGGIGTLFVVAWTAWRLPHLRNYGALVDDSGIDSSQGARRAAGLEQTSHTDSPGESPDRRS